MKTYVFEGTITALTSISHIGESHGVNAKLRREKIVQPNGEVEEVPIISGNSLRGILRDCGMIHMLRTLGYGVNGETGQVQGLSLAAFYFLLSGGALTKQSSRGLDIDEARRWRELIPLVAIFGGAMGNQIMPGKLKVGKAIPICAETAHILPERLSEGRSNVSVWDLLQEEAYTRRDDEKDENKRELIAPSVRMLVEAEQSAKRAKARQGDDSVGETGQKQQMRYYVETIAPGTLLYWELTMDDVSPVEFEAFCVTLAEFSRRPYIGGKNGVGHGKVSINFDQWISIDPRVAPQGEALAPALGALYMQHLERNAETIRGMIDGFQ